VAANEIDRAVAKSEGTRVSVENEVLAELVQIKWLLGGLFVAVLLSIVFFMAATALRVRTSNTQALLLIRDNLLAELNLIESAGNYEQMLSKAEELLGSYPNDLMANWYHARANHKTGNLGAALSALGRIKSINNVWSTEAVEEFVAQIKSEMGGPRKRDA
jgi:hypothetical protein